MYGPAFPVSEEEILNNSPYETLKVSNILKSNLDGVIIGTTNMTIVSELSHGEILLIIVSL